MTPPFRTLLFVGAGLLWTCTPPPQWVEMQPIFRSSCGLSNQLYDISCVSSFEFRVVDPSGTILEQNCTDVTGLFSRMADIYQQDETVTLMEGVERRSNVYLEFRGYHAANGVPCDNLATSNLMLWGRSDLLDFTRTDLEQIAVFHECRPGCDCSELSNNPQCPLAMTPGVCVPPETLSCRRSCSGEDCYGGEVPCDQDMCTPHDGGLCDDCTTSSSCDSEVCVLSMDENFCSQPCPPESGSAPCPKEMSCRQAGGTWTIADP